MDAISSVGVISPDFHHNIALKPIVDYSILYLALENFHLKNLYEL